MRYYFWVDKASGRENPCEECGKPFKMGEKRVNLIKGAYKSYFRYARIHCSCFLMLLVKIFPELDIKDNKIKKEIVLKGLNDRGI